VQILEWYRGDRRTLKQVARDHGVSTATIRNLIHRYEPTSSTSSDPSAPARIEFRPTPRKG
jgi:transposase